MNTSFQREMLFSLPPTTNSQEEAMTENTTKLIRQDQLTMPKRVALASLFAGLS